MFFPTPFLFNTMFASVSPPRLLPTVRVLPLGLLISMLLCMLLLCMLLGPASAFAQEEATLLVRESGTFRSARAISIVHTNATGTTVPDTASFREDDVLYFRYQPTDDWQMSNRDAEDLETIQIQQGSTRIAPMNVRVNEVQNVAVARFPKADFDVTESFLLRNAIAESTPLKIDESFYPGYTRLSTAYEAARDTVKNAPLEAVRRLTVLVQEDSLAEPFSFYMRARAVLDSAAFRALDRESETLRSLRQEMASPSAEGLADVDAFRARLDSVEAVMRFYLADTTVSARVNSRKQMDLLVESAADMRESAYRSYRESVLRIYLRGNYDNYQMGRSLALLTRMLIDPAYTTEDDVLDLDTLSVQRLDAPRFTELSTELAAYGWLGRFRETLAIVNTNIREEQRVFGEEVMRNLRLQRPGAPEPYYEMLAALNAVGEGDRAALNENLERALAKSTTTGLVHDLQLWRMVEHPSQQTMTPQVRDMISEGRSFYESGQLERARTSLVRASRMAGGYPPVQYYLGQIARAEGNTSSALVYFDRAIELEPTYAMPSIAAVDALLEAESFERAVAHADSALADHPYWTLYYRKAQALIGQEAHEEARAVLRGRCEPLNDESFDLYITLGDTYMATRQWSGARWAYEEAGSLRPDNQRFASRMEQLRNRISDAGLSFQDIAPQETTRQLSGGSDDGG